MFANNPIVFADPSGLVEEKKDENPSKNYKYSEITVTTQKETYNTWLPFASLSTQSPTEKKLEQQQRTNESNTGKSAVSNFAKNLGIGVQGTNNSSVVDDIYPIILAPIPGYNSTKDIVEGIENGDYSKVAWGSTQVFLEIIPGEIIANKIIVSTSKWADRLKKTKIVAKIGGVLKFKKFTHNYFRHNLRTLTNLDPKNAQAHHVFPRKFEELFKKLGINIHDPTFGVWWETTSHKKNAYEYNKKWEVFLEDLPTKQDVLDFGKKIMKEYNYECNF